MMIDNKQLNHNFRPVCLGITLDPSLIYKEHLEKTKQKIKTRNNIIQKLAGTTWGADARTLRTASLALVYSVAEYCAPVWINSCHTSIIDTQLNCTMRTISGTLKSTPLEWLPVLTHIAPPGVRRKTALKKEWIKCQNNSNLPIWMDLMNPPPKRLKSRRPFWAQEISDRSEDEEWKTLWAEVNFYNKNLIVDPTKEIAGFDLERKNWTKLNRIRTGHAKCNSMLYKWNAISNPKCECGHEEETVHHIVQECQLTKFEGNIADIHNLTTEALTWLNNLKNI